MYRLSYVANDGGTRTRNHPVRNRRNPRLPSKFQRTQQPHRHRRRAASPGLEPGPPGSEPGVVPVPPARTVTKRTPKGSGAWSRPLWSGRRDSNSQPPASDAGAWPVALRPVGTHGESRTRTGRGLSAVPLPVGLRELVRGPGGSRTRSRLLARETLLPVQLAQWWWRERGSNPPRAANEAALISRSPAAMG